MSAPDAAVEDGARDLIEATSVRDVTVIQALHSEDSAAAKVAKRLASTAVGRAILDSPDYQRIENTRTGDELADVLLTITDRERRGVLLRAYFFGEVDKKPRKPSRPRIATLIKRAEETGRPVTSITTPDGTTIHFGETNPTDASNPWLADLRKATKQ